MCCLLSCGLLFLIWSFYHLLNDQSSFSPMEDNPSSHTIIKDKLEESAGDCNRNDGLTQTNPAPLPPLNIEIPNQVKDEVTSTLATGYEPDTCIPQQLQLQQPERAAAVADDKQVPDGNLAASLQPEKSESRDVVSVSKSEDTPHTYNGTLVHSGRSQPSTQSPSPPPPQAAPIAAPAVSLGEWRGWTHAVVAGETLLGIAAALRVPMDALLAANRADIPDPDLIYAGQILRVPELPRLADDVVVPASLCRTSAHPHILAGSPVSSAAVAERLCVDVARRRGWLQRRS
jgi:LysM repeat protein